MRKRDLQAAIRAASYFFIAANELEKQLVVGMPVRLADVVAVRNHAAALSEALVPLTEKTTEACEI